MTERIDNTASSQAPEVTIPKKEKVLSLVPDEEKKIQSSEKAEVAAIAPSASSVALTPEGVLNFPGTEKKIKELKKKTATGGTVPPSVAKKVGAIIAAGAAAITGLEGATIIAAGETGNLPGSMQKGYNEFKANIKNRFIPGKNGETFVDITETSKSPETTVAPTTTVVETTTTTEAEIINAPEIAGLSFNQETKTYISEAGNPYGLEAGMEAGVYIKDALKFDGEMEDSIGLNPAVIESLQNTINKETGEFTTFIPIDLSETKGVEVTQTEIISGNLQGIVNYGMNVPKETILYAVSSGEWYDGHLKSQYPEKINSNKEGTDDKSMSTMYGNKELNAFWMTFFSDGNIISEVKEVGKSYLAKEENGKEVYEEIPINIYDIKMGEPIIKITGDGILDLTANNILNYPFTYKDSGAYQVCLSNCVFKNDGKTYQINILEIPNNNKESLKVFILPKKS